MDEEGAECDKLVLLGGLARRIASSRGGNLQEREGCVFRRSVAVDISMQQKGLVNLSFVREEKPLLSKTVEIKPKE